MVYGWKIGKFNTPKLNENRMQMLLPVGRRFRMPIKGFVEWRTWLMKMLLVVRNKLWRQKNISAMFGVKFSLSVSSHGIAGGNTM